MKQEHVVVITLDSDLRTIKKRTVFIGTVSASLIHPREIFAGAIEDRASAIIVAHNHPSGDVTPSKEDREIAEILESAGMLMGIEAIDNIIVADNDYYSVVGDEGDTYLYSKQT